LIKGEAHERAIIDMRMAVHRGGCTGGEGVRSSELTQEDRWPAR
jgi:hypothetical protein